MVTPAGKDLLRNSIHNAKFHNRILEENEMWRQWELEKRLTMMVSDDVIKKKSHRCHYHERKKKAKLEKARHKMRSEKSFTSCEKLSFPNSSEKWDHSGFKELYPQDPASTDTTSPNKRFKKYKSNHTDSDVSSDSTDEDVWQEFKKFRTMKTKYSARKERHATSKVLHSSLKRDKYINKIAKKK